jgi:hypothetical protein
MVAPSRAKAKAEARPMPLEAPVTTMVFPSNLDLRAIVFSYHVYLHVYGPK